MWSLKVEHTGQTDARTGRPQSQVELQSHIEVSHSCSSVRNQQVRQGLRAMYVEGRAEWRCEALTRCFVPMLCATSWNIVHSLSALVDFIRHKSGCLLATCLQDDFVDWVTGKCTLKDTENVAIRQHCQVSVERQAGQCCCMCQAVDAATCSNLCRSCCLPRTGEDGLVPD